MIATKVSTSSNHPTSSENKQNQLSEAEKIIDGSTNELSNLGISEVANFYKDKNVLITGASGFLGKVLLLKLIEACPDIRKIYVLIRSKNTTSAQDRLIQMLKSKPFNFNHHHEDLLQKIVAIEADMAQPGLGLSLSDEQLLEKEVNIVIHSAASVKFDAPIKDNMRDNVLGTRSIVKLCNKIENLKALVHVSTAYSNCQEKDIAEDLQPLQRNIDDVTLLVDSLPDDICDLVTAKLLEGRPNTYTYTKAVAEHYVAREEGKYPISIVRPSIVIPSYKEPCPGWVDNFNGMAGLGSLAAIGVLRDIDWNYYAISDMVPVDYVANCIICAAYQVSVKSPQKIIIHNMTSGNIKPISWGHFFDKLRDECVKRPPNKVIRPIIRAPRHTRANPFLFAITNYSEIFFAHLVDMILVLLGYKKILVKITQKMHHGYNILKPFTTNEWNFDSTNVLELSDSLSTTDKELFHFNMSDFDWNQECVSLYDGLRNFLLKEPETEESYKAGRRKHNIVTLIHYGFLVFITLTLSYIGYSTARLIIA